MNGTPLPLSLAGGISQLTGDVTAGPGKGSQAATLATVNASPGTYALATVAVNGKGLVTSASAASTTGSGNVVLATSPTIVTPTIAKLANLTTNGFVKTSGADGTLGIDTSTYITGNQTITLTGVVTGSGTTAITTAFNSSTGSGAVVLATSPALTSPTTTTLAASGAITDTQSIAATSTDGFVLTNTTAAAAGAQQWSPRLRLTGQGWKTTATAASQTVDWIIENQPVQGAANPTTNLVISSQVNAAGYTARQTLDSSGNVVFTGSVNAVGGGAAAAPAFMIGTQRGLFSTSQAFLNVSASNTDIASFSNKGLTMGSSWQIGFSASIAPGTTSPDTGFARDAAGVIRVSNGSTGVGALGIVDTSTAALTNVLTLAHILTTANAGAAGIAAGMSFGAADSTSAIGAYVTVAAINASLPVATHASRTGRVDITVTDSAATRTTESHGANGTAAQWGVFGSLAIQFATTGTSAGFTAGVGTPATSTSTYTGGTGSTAYTVGDLVLALKTSGQIAA